MLGYTYWHQLFVYSCNSWLLSTYMLFSVIPQLSVYHVFSYLMSAVYLDIILCTLFICTSTILCTHTHQVAFWRPWIHTSRYWMHCFYCSGVGWDHTYCEEQESLSPLFWYTHLSYLPVISLFSICQIRSLIQFLIYMISCVNAYMWYCSNHVHCSWDL